MGHDEPGGKKQGVPERRGGLLLISELLVDESEEIEGKGVRPVPADDPPELFEGVLPEPPVREASGFFEAVVRGIFRRGFSRAVRFFSAGISCEQGILFFRCRSPAGEKILEGQNGLLPFA
ncbi:hypothetical protein SDC9_75415 [bioreactor metagenome]|uniref:Uncharacterized protein n=1 Tax=bioreactor metagenome TaxID=1076179 RepID=A0A644YLK9_9ZZZZ